MILENFAGFLTCGQTHRSATRRRERELRRSEQKEDVEDPHQGINQSNKYCHLQKYIKDQSIKVKRKLKRFKQKEGVEDPHHIQSDIKVIK